MEITLSSKQLLVKIGEVKAIGSSWERNGNHITIVSIYTENNSKELVPDSLFKDVANSSYKSDIGRK